MAIIRAVPQRFMSFLIARILFEDKVPIQKQAETIANPVEPNPYLSVVIYGRVTKLFPIKHNPTIIIDKETGKISLEFLTLINASIISFLIFFNLKGSFLKDGFGSFKEK